MKKEVSVNILMSTYNGEKYIFGQIESILNQTNVNIKLNIRDDGSNDSTKEILNELSKLHQNLHFNFEDNIGYKRSFMDLVYTANLDCDYYAFADQDDIWLEDKMIRAIGKIGETNEPALYFSNCLMVDNDLKEIGLLHKQPLEISSSLSNRIINGFAHGCTMVMNKAAFKLIRNYKIEKALAHDYWIPLVISEFGKIIYDYESRILYRQHSNNVFGGTNISLPKLIKNKINKMDEEKNYYSEVAKQFLDRYKPKLNPAKVKELDIIINYKKSIMKKLTLIFNGNIRRNNLRGTLYLKLLIILNRF